MAKTDKYTRVAQIEIDKDTLGSMYREYAKTRDPDLKQMLVAYNMGLVYNEANKWKRKFPTASLEDLYQEGSLGLLEALDKFEPERGWVLSTYAVPSIKARIQEFLNRSAGIPKSKVRLASKISLKARELTQKLSREPTDEEIAEELGIEASEVAETRVLARPKLSLDTPLDEDGSGRSIGDQVEDAGQDPEAAGSSSLERERVRGILKNLEPREQDVVKMIFGIMPYKQTYTYEEIGRKWGVTKQAVYQIWQQAQKKLKDMLE